MVSMVGEVGTVSVVVRIQGGSHQAVPIRSHLESSQTSVMCEIDRKCDAVVMGNRDHNECTNRASIPRYSSSSTD